MSMVTSGRMSGAGAGINIQIDTIDVLLMIDKKIATMTGNMIVKQLQSDGRQMFLAQHSECPVRTGYLRSTGRFVLTQYGFEITWGDSVAYYWRYVEYGTSKMRGRYFITRNFYKYQQQLWNNFRRTLARGS